MDVSQQLQLIDLDLYIRDPSSPLARAECAKAANALVLQGALILKTSSVSASSNNRFLDTLEDYFNQSPELLAQDERPQFGFQVGTTLENTEKPKCHSSQECQKVIRDLAPEERPLDMHNQFADPKCRFFWRMGETPPYTSAFAQQYMDNVVPPAFEGIWKETLESYGGLLKSAAEHLAVMIAIGFDLEPSHFKDAGRYGPHLLAPTATDLERFGKKDSIWAGFHTDLNALSIHGQSRYPGLHLWGRNSGKKIAARVPDGCLLVQAGKQLEIVTGGLVKAGYHEVCCTDATLAAIEKRKASHPDRPLWRISSTFFYHFSSDHDITPLPELAARAKDLRLRLGETAEEEPYKEWRGKKVGDEVLHELGLISLV